MTIELADPHALELLVDVLTSDAIQIIDLGSRSDASDNPQMKALGDGFRVEVGIVVWEGHDVLEIPVSALFRSEQRWAVWGIDQGRATPRDARNFPLDQSSRPL